MLLLASTAVLSWHLSGIQQSCQANTSEKALPNTSEKAPATTSAKAPPKTSAPSINVLPASHNFGKIDEGIKVNHVFQVRNNGRRTLIIKDAKPTCDCTTVKLGARQIPAHKSTNLDVTVDTTMKLGDITKEILITSNDPLHPQMKISLIAQVDPHQGMATRGPSKLFTGRCATCHVKQGIGKTGEDLYIADCAMCHGFRADGANAPSLISTDLEDSEARTRLKDITSFGSKINPIAMPGFIKEAGGPLTSQEIDSLVEYLRWRRSIKKAN